MKRFVSIGLPLLLASASTLLSGCASLVPGAAFQGFEGRFVDRVTLERADEVRGNVPPGRRRGEPHPITKLDGFRGSGMLEDPSLERMLGGLRDRLLEAYPHPVPQIGIFATSGLDYMASATVGGDVLLDLGVLRDAATEDELAFVVAHELSHVLLGHFERDAVLEAQSKATDLATGTVMASLVIGQTRVMKTPQGYTLQIDDSEGLSTDLTKVALGYLAVQEMTGTVFAPAWSRAQEDEADLLGLDLVMRSGYSPGYALESLERFESSAEERAARRSARLKQYVADYAKLAAAAALSENDAAMREVLTLIGVHGSAGLMNWVRGALRSSHPGAEHRRTNLEGYYRREYQESLGEAPELDRTFEKLKRQGRIATLVDNHMRAHEARAALAEGRMSEAASLGLRSVSGPTTSASFPRLVMYEVRKAQGRHDLALQNLLLAKRSRSPSASIYVALGEEYRQRRQYGRALETIDEGVRRTQSEQPFLPSRISVARESGLADQVTAALDRCEAAGDEHLLKRCREAAGVQPDVAAEPSIFDPGKLGKSLSDALGTLTGGDD